MGVRNRGVAAATAAARHPRALTAAGPDERGRLPGFQRSARSCLVRLGSGVALGPTADGRALPSVIFRPGSLLNTAINVTLGPSEDRILQTGKHTVQDCMCRGCGERVGWRYEAASEIAQR
jgi:hypothetical protein